MCPSKINRTKINRAKRIFFNTEKIRTTFGFHLLLPARRDRFPFNDDGVRGVHAKFHGRLLRRVRFSPLSFFTPHKAAAAAAAATHLNLT